MDKLMSLGANKQNKEPTQDNQNRLRLHIPKGD
jgi:hypothetical protein